jgi:hypothetical protein
MSKIRAIHHRQITLECILGIYWCIIEEGFHDSVNAKETYLILCLILFSDVLSAHLIIPVSSALAYARKLSTDVTVPPE